MPDRTLDHIRLTWEHRYRYAYNASWKSTCDLSWPAAYGVPHTSELSFVFGTPVYPWGPPYAPCAFTAREQIFADQVGRWWTNFAASGNPNVRTAGAGAGGTAAGVVEWPPYDSTTQTELLLNISGNGGDGSVVSSYRSGMCKLFERVWNRTHPQLLEEHTPQVTDVRLKADDKELGGPNSSSGSRCCPNDPTGCPGDLCCSLNGVLQPSSSGGGRHSAPTCVCEKPWFGRRCEQMRFKPLPALPQGYGMKPRLSSWGGNALYNVKDGLFHGYFAAMSNNCTLNTWQTNSQIEHAVASRVTGPYTKVDVAVPTSTLTHSKRPKIYFDPQTGEMTHLFNGVSGLASCFGGPGASQNLGDRDGEAVARQDKTPAMVFPPAPPGFQRLLQHCMSEQPCKAGCNCASHAFIKDFRQCKPFPTGCFAAVRGITMTMTHFNLT